jgi:hypothetical protein
MQSRGMQLFDAFLSSMSKLSKTPLNHWAGLAVDVPFGVVLIFAGLHSIEIRPIRVVLTILLGAFLFSIIEYSFHRWLFHGSMQIMAQGHRAHHVNPLSYDSLPFFLPALIPLAFAGVFLLLVPAMYAFLLTGTLCLS